MVKSGLPTTSCGTEPLSVTVASFVSAWAGAERLGAPARTASVGGGDGEVVTAWGKPSNSEPTLAAARPTWPLAAQAANTASAATAGPRGAGEGMGAGPPLS